MKMLAQGRISVAIPYHAIVEKKEKNIFLVI